MRTKLVTTLKRKATDLLSDLARDKAPILITQHELRSAYLVDINNHDKLLEGIARGERAAEEGQTVSNSQAKGKMARWLT